MAWLAWWLARMELGLQRLAGGASSSHRSTPRSRRMSGANTEKNYKKNNIIVPERFFLIVGLIWSFLMSNSNYAPRNPPLGQFLAPKFPPEHLLGRNDRIDL